MKKDLAILLILVWPITFLTPVVTWADFPEAGIDETSALGKFKIKLTDKFANRYGVNEVESALLFDAHTVISRSSQHFDGDNVDKLTGAFICQEGSNDSCVNAIGIRITDLEFKKPIPDPSKENPFIDGPTGTEEIHAQLLSLNMTGTEMCSSGRSGQAMRAGSAAPYAPYSFGEVESLNTVTGSFPAESFLNLFVEIDLDLADLQVTLFNKEPIIFQASNLMQFPIRLIYQHEVTDEPIPVYNQNTGELVGVITQAAYGMDFDCEDQEEFKQVYDSLGSSSPSTPLSVNFVDFIASVNKGQVFLKWQTASEQDHTGFHLWRAKKDQNGKYTEVIRITDQLIPARGSLDQGVAYSYEDATVDMGSTYDYALEEIDSEGLSNINLELIKAVRVEND